MPRLPALIAAIGLSAATGCGAPAATVAGTPLAPNGSAARPVRDGPLEFVVREVTRARRVGDPADPGLSVTARGKYVVVSLAIRNLGERPHTFLDRDQTLIDGRGERFEVSMAADIYANLGIASTTMNPGESLEVDIVFDVPEAIVPAGLVLRASGDSAGVTVPL